VEFCCFLFKGGTKRGAKAVIECAGGCLPPSLKTLNFCTGECYASLVCISTLCTPSTCWYCNNTLSIYFINVN
jgi:hypothetical protein